MFVPDGVEVGELLSGVTAEVVTVDRVDLTDVVFDDVDVDDELVADFVVTEEAGIHCE